MQSQSVEVDFSEASIMLCKASLFGDAPSFEKIKQAKTPMQAKSLGRQVKNFDNSVWMTAVIDIATEVVFQKMKSDKRLIDLLLSTENLLIAETAPRDTLWGIGMGKSNVDIYNPQKWNGANVLGLALMRARETLSNGDM